MMTHKWNRRPPYAKLLPAHNWL